MITSKLETQLNDLVGADYELLLQNLYCQLQTNSFEQSEIIESGFSFSASLKDISRFIVTFLIEQGDLTTALLIVQNWDRFVKALDDPSLIIDSDQIPFSIFCESYYSAIDYFKKQFLTHLGEKVELDLQEVTNPNVLNFIKQAGLRQRKFTYSLEQTGKFSIQIVNTTTIRTYEVKKGEREKIEMLNSIFLRFLIRKYEASDLLRMLVTKFPELTDELVNLYNAALDTELAVGDTLVEISPPFEQYSYQQDCMIRTYTFNGSGFSVNQYSIPYFEEEIPSVLTNMILTFGGKQVTTSLHTTFSSNNVLGNFFILNGDLGRSVVNLFPSIQEFGGVKVIEEANQLVTPRIIFIEDIIQPFIINYINSPGFTSGDHERQVNNYRNIFLAAVATLDSNTHSKYPEVKDILESGSLLTSAVHGEDITQVLLEASNGQIATLHVQADGYCDSISANLGEQDTDITSYNEQTIKSLTFKGKISSLSKEENVELDLLKFEDSNGNEKRLFKCPVCLQKGSTTYVDICDKKCSQCSIKLEELRIASENRNLAGFIQSKLQQNQSTENGNGIFGILFDLFGAVFTIF